MPFHLQTKSGSRNRRRHTLPWCAFFALLGFVLGWMARGFLHL